MHWSPCARGPRTLLWFGHGCTGHRVLVDHERYYGLGTDALVTVCSWTRNVIMVWTWMHWSPCARGPETSLWFGHGCTGHRVLVDHERYYGLGTDALVTVCSWTTDVIMVPAWMHWSPCARGPETSLWFGHGCTDRRVLVDHERYYGAWMHWSPCARGPETSLWFLHGCTGLRVLVDQKRRYGLGMDALVTVCSWTTNVIMVWARMHWSPCARGPETSLWFGHRCTGLRVLVDQKRHYGLDMDALVTVCSWTRNVIMVWAWMHWSPCARGPEMSLWLEHGCTGHRLQKY